MLKSEAIENVHSLLSRVPLVYCATIDFKGCPDIRAMMNLRSRFLFPQLTDKFNEKSFDTYLPVNTYSGKVKQIQENPNASLYLYDVTTRESALLSGEIHLINDRKLRAAFWQPEWEQYFPGSVDGEEYSLVSFTAERFKYYNGLHEAYENDISR